MTLPIALTIIVNIPALDRLVSFLETGQQAQIDALTATVKASTAGLSTSETALQGAIKKEQHT